MSSKIKLDLRNFKHLKSDKQTTTLRHKDGHEITLHHPSLSPESAEQLRSLSNIAKDARTPLEQDDAKHDKYAKGGEVNPKLEQSKETPSLDYNKIRKEKREMNNKEANTPKRHAEGGEVCYACGGPVHFDGGGKVPASRGEAEHSDPNANNRDVANASRRGGSTAQTSKAANYVSNPSSIVDTIKNAWAQGGEVKQYAEGDVVDPNPSFASRIGSFVGDTVVPGVDQAFHDATAPIRAAGQGVHEFGQGLRTSMGNQTPEDVAEIQGKQPQATEVTPEAVAATQAQADASAQDQKAVQADMVARAADQNATKASGGQPTGLQSGIQSPAMGLQSGINQQIQGLNQQAAAQGKLGEQQADVLAQKADQQMVAQKTFKESFDALNQERQNHIHDIQNGYIDPDQYWNGHTDTEGNTVGGHSKIASAIGMIIAGFNPSTKPNAAIEFLNKQLEMNLQAQKETLGAKKSLLESNLRQFGNIRDAMDMTRVMQNDMVANQLQAAAAKAQSPIQAAIAKQAAGKIITDTAPLAMKLSAMQSISKLTQSGDTGAIGPVIAQLQAYYPEMGKTVSEAYVPGVGVSSSLTPIPASVRDEIVAHKKLDDAANDLLAFSKSHTTINPMSKDYKIGAQKAEILQQMVREGMLGTVFRESEKPLLQKMVDSNPAGVFKLISTEPKLRTLLEGSRMQLNALKKTYGLPIDSSQQQHQEQPQVKTMNGVQYQKVQGGWQKVK